MFQVSLSLVLCCIERCLEFLCGSVCADGYNVKVKGFKNYYTISLISLIQMLPVCFADCNINAKWNLTMELASIGLPWWAQERKVLQTQRKSCRPSCIAFCLFCWTTSVILLSWYPTVGHRSSPNNVMSNDRSNYSLGKLILLLRTTTTRLTKLGLDYYRGNK